MKYPIGAFLAYSRSDNSVSASPPGSTWLELIGSDYLRRIGTPLALCHSLYHSLLGYTWLHSFITCLVSQRLWSWQHLIFLNFS